jgi:hypothetical protein
VKNFGLRSSISPFVFDLRNPISDLFFQALLFQQNLNLQNKWYTTKFVKKHKKAIIITTVVVVAATAVIVATSGAAAAGTAGALGAMAAGGMDDSEKPKRHINKAGDVFFQEDQYPPTTQFAQNYQKSPPNPRMSHF